MIVTEGPVKFDEDLKKVTPWWDVVSQYLIAAMMAIALTSTAVQLTKDNLICIPAIDCSHVAGQNNHTKLPAVNVSQDTAKICQSLTPKSLKKKVLTKMDDRRFYDYIDSVCYQDLSWFTGFFPLIIFGQTVLLLVCHLLWTKLPFSSSILNHFVVLANEAYSSFGTLANILKITKTEALGDEARPHASSSGSHVDILNKKPPLVSEADAQVQIVVEKADIFREKYCRHSSLFHWYIICVGFRFLICLVSIIINSIYFSSSFPTTKQCNLDEFVFTKEYDYFQCSYPLAPYFKILSILFLIPLCFHLVMSSFGICKTIKHGKSFNFKDEQRYVDFAFLYFLLKQYDELYAKQVSDFFLPETKEVLPAKLDEKYRNN